MKVEFDSQGTYQLLTGPPGGSQQALPLLAALPPAQAALHLALPHSKWGRMNGHQEEIISLPSQRQVGGEEISMY